MALHLYTISNASHCHITETQVMLAEPGSYVKVHKINALRLYERRLSSKLASSLEQECGQPSEERGKFRHKFRPPRTISVLARATDPPTRSESERATVKSLPKTFAAATVKTPLIPDRENGP